MKRANKKVNLFLDSGAFSAFKQGVKIDIEEYIEFIKEYEDGIDLYSNLDVIAVGDISPKEAAERTLTNQHRMEKAGLSPVPVFHYNEPIRYLENYVKDYEYISLGGMVPVSNNQLINWLNDIWENYLTDANGFPKIKVHGFGMTSLDLMHRYPWYSVDSTSWVITGRLGSIYVPRYRKGKWIYDQDSWKITVSNKSPERKEAGKHIDTLSPIQREIVLNYIHDKGFKLGESEFKKMPVDYEPKANETWSQNKKDVGDDGQRLLEVIKEPGVSNKYQHRDELNIIYFQDLEQNQREWPWAFKTKSKIKSLF